MLCWICEVLRSDERLLHFNRRLQRLTDRSKEAKYEIRICSLAVWCLSSARTLWIWMQREDFGQSIFIAYWEWYCNVSASNSMFTILWKQTNTKQTENMKCKMGDTCCISPTQPYCMCWSVWLERSRGWGRVEGQFVDFDCLEVHLTESFHTKI